MRILARWIEHPLDAAVQCPHDADPREHRRAAVRRHQDQGFHRRLPIQRFVFRLRQFGYVGAGVLQRYELPSVGQRDGIIEGALPRQTLSRRLLVRQL
jgi:hypothetical protein